MIYPDLSKLCTSLEAIRGIFQNYFQEAFIRITLFSIRNIIKLQIRKNSNEIALTNTGYLIDITKSIKKSFSTSPTSVVRISNILIQG
jgi:hypothetical protein